MILFIIASSLITLVAILFGAGIYVILALLEESEEDDARHMLGLDTSDFTSTPVVSPHEILVSTGESEQSIRMIEGVDCYCTLREKIEAAAGNLRVDKSDEGTTKDDTLNSALLDAPVDSETRSNGPPIEIVGLTKEDIRSARLNSRLLKASDKQRETDLDEPQSPTVDQKLISDGAEGATEQQTQEEPVAEYVDWQDAPCAQKAKITSLMGAAQAQQVLDDLDSREMHLGGSVLHWCKTRPTLDKLVELGIPLDALNERRETALHVAIRRHKLQVLIGLVIHGADIEARNGFKETPLIVACKVRNIFAVQLLLIYEANPDATDKFGFTARHHTAIICEHNQAQSQAQAPSAAHLILAMLNEIGAKRCRTRPSRLPLRINPEEEPPATFSPETSAINTKRTSPQKQPATPAVKLSRITTCSEGCSSSGIYNGNSYNRWPNFKRESLYKRHVFNDIIESHLSEARQSQGNKGSDGQSRSSERKSRLLCIDGGGLRGVIVCQILIELQKYVKQPIASYFDWMGGTSVGAFIACAICIGIPLDRLRQICFDVKDEVFNGGRPYNSQFIERVLRRTFGTKRRFSDIKHKKLAVTTVLADREPCQLRLFRNYTSTNVLLERFGYSPDTFNIMSGHSVVSDAPPQSSDVTNGPVRTPKNNIAGKQVTKEIVACIAETEKSDRKQGETIAIKQVAELGGKILPNTIGTQTDEHSHEPILDENDPDPLIWKVVRASTAAPFYFKPYGPYLDGGILSNNPTLDMLNEFESYQKVRKFLLSHVGRDNVNSAGHSLYADCESTSKLNLVVSLGTGRGRIIGRQAMVDFGQVATGFSTVFSPIELVRSIRAAREIFRKLMQQSCHTDDYILDRAQAWCSSLEIPYFRVNPPLAAIFSIDDKRDEQLINALWQTKLYMRAMKDQLSELGQLLDGSSSGHA